MCSSLLSKTTFWSLTDPAVCDLVPQKPDSLPEYFIGLPVIGIQFMSEMLLRLHFVFFRGLRTFARQHIVNRKRFGFVLVSYYKNQNWFTAVRHYLSKIFIFVRSALVS